MCLLSLVIPVLNETQNICVLIRSVHEQDYRPLEVIVVDGGSVDGTIECLHTLQDELGSDSFRLVLLSEKDHGNYKSAGNARNIGVAKASAPFIAFFDADFVLLQKDTLSKVVASLQSRSCVGLKVKPLAETWIEWQASLDDFRADLGTNVHKFFGYRREVFKKAIFDPSLGWGEDQDFQMRAGLTEPYYIDATCGRHFVHSLEEWKKQSRWYGRTYLRFCRKHGINPWRTIAQMSIAPSLLVCILATGALLGPLSSTIPLILLLGQVFRKSMHRMESTLKRAPYVFLRETLASVWFLQSFLNSYLRQSAPSRG